MNRADNYDQTDPIDAEFEKQEQPGRSLVPTYTVPAPVADYWVRRRVDLPRDLREVDTRLMQEANLAGEDFYYAWGKGENRVEGGSIVLAMALARCWGNCVIEQLPLQETHDAYVFTARYIDLETGFTFDRQFRQSKKRQVHGNFDAARKDEMRFSIGQSKAARNCILRALPEWLKNKAIATAKEGVRERLEKYIAKEGIAAAQKIVVSALLKEGVPEPRILAHFEIAAMTALDINMLVELRGALRAIQSGEEHADSIFPPTDEEVAEKAAKANANGKETIKTDLDAVAASLAGKKPTDPPERKKAEKSKAEKAESKGETKSEQKAETAANAEQKGASPIKLSELDRVLSRAKTGEDLDGEWTIYFETHLLNDAEMVAAEALWQQHTKRINNPVQSVEPAAEVASTQPSDKAVEFARQFGPSRTKAGVNKTLERAKAEGFTDVDLAFLTSKAQARIKELETSQ